MFAITSEDSIDLAIVQRVLKVLILCIVVKVVIEPRVIDSVYVDMVVGAGKGFPEEGIVPLGVGSMGRVKILRLIAGFGDGQSLSDPVNGRVCGTEPEESKDDILASTAHDVEEMFLSNPFNVSIEGAGIMNHTSFVCSLVDIVNGNGGGKFLSGESVFSDKLPVDARDVSTRVYQCGRVDNFEGVREGDQLNRDLHRFIQS